MGFSGSVSLVRAAGFGTLPELVEDRAGERVLTDIFERERVPLALRDAPMTPLPLAAMMGVFERAATKLGDRVLGLEVGEQMTHRGYGLWAEYCAGAATLGEGIDRIVQSSWSHLTGGHLEQVDDGAYRILRFASPKVRVGKAQHSDHVVPPMRAFVRSYLGARWNPDRVEVDYPRDRGIAQAEDWLQTAVHCGRPGAGLSLRMSDLKQPRSVRIEDSVRIVTLRDVLADVVLADAPEPARALSAVVALRLMDGRSDIDGAARMVGLGVQGLQRRLREKGYTYREIVDEARHFRAVRLLTETRMSVLSIALSLGYETHAAFTRAFVRWSGCTPVEYRRKGFRHAA